ncbi:MAG TPA: Mth938-like domain-containing protein [Gemmatimonadaceae bacterium]|nr:Mth938-like domain-containing protein [Gemmatimonadaceae bacterium]
MKLHLARAPGRNEFTGYGEGYVAVNNERYDRALVVSAHHAVQAWDAHDIEGLSPADFDTVLALNPEIVILGTGGTLRFPRPEIMRTFAANAIGFEVMDTKAACRTYNVLVTEGRQVVAAILI